MRFSISFQYRQFTVFMQCLICQYLLLYDLLQSLISESLWLITILLFGYFFDQSNFLFHSEYINPIMR